MKKKQQKKVATTTENSQDKGTYGIWRQYNEFIRQLYLEKPLKKPTGKQKTLKYLGKLAIVFFGALFTTLTFYFLIDPNGLYNSGLNGLLQSGSKLLIGRNNMSWTNYYLIYYGLGLLTNLLFILILRILFKAKLEIISTSIFYVLSQIIWTQIFNFLNLRGYIFNRFNPNSWQGLSASSQLSFTLPYYIVIAIVAAIIHTYGYSLIFQSQATPGGLEIITSHFSTREKGRKFSISTFMKIFGLIIIFLVTLVNFTMIEDNSKMKKSLLEKDLEDQKEKLAEGGMKITGSITDTLDKWRKDMKEAKQLEKKNDKDIKKILEIREKNRPLTSFLKRKIGYQQLENYPQEVDYYLAQDRERKNKLETEKEKIEKRLDNISGEKLVRKLRRKNDLEARIKELDKELERNFLPKYLSYITNNERLWATLIYIFLSSFLISQIFPRDQIILLRLHSLTESNRNKGLKLLKKFSPVYYTVYRKSGDKEEVVYVINCHLSKWNYYLLSPYLKQVGTPYSSEISSN
ncbi:MAG: YitT family protein [Candidatus Moeniiplasma glomeromycotorum]|nr:YitT family protein [Candidatus Moeniiplasma glomeromycotorum]MCE8169352.1 YitT family protein [Candidatus Moeniiplasma glomeromycotorum]